MNDYIEVRLDISPCDETSTDLLAALLCNKDYVFMAHLSICSTFIPSILTIMALMALNGCKNHDKKKEFFDETVFKEVIADFPFEATIEVRWSTVEGRDWNAEWEKNYFKPIVIDNQCVIHSSFHTDIPSLPYDIRVRIRQSRQH